MATVSPKLLKRVSDEFLYGRRGSRGSRGSSSSSRRRSSLGSDVSITDKILSMLVMEETKVHLPEDRIFLESLCLMN